MPIIPDLPSVQGDWRPATPSLRTAMAPGFALADLGQDIGTVANVATEISQKIQNVRNEDAIVQMRSGVMKAQADHEIFRSKSPDPSTWEADMQQRYSNLADNFKNLKLNPDGRRQLDQTFALTRAQDLENTRVAATQYEITRARQNVANLDLKYRQGGNYSEARALQDRGVETGIYTQVEVDENKADIDREEKENKVKTSYQNFLTVADMYPLDVRQKLSEKNADGTWAYGTEIEPGARNRLFNIVETNISKQTLSELELFTYALHANEATSSEVLSMPQYLNDGQKKAILDNHARVDPPSFEEQNQAWEISDQLRQARDNPTVSQKDYINLFIDSRTKILPLAPASYTWDVAREIDSLSPTKRADGGGPLDPAYSREDLEYSGRNIIRQAWETGHYWNINSADKVSRETTLRTAEMDRNALNRWIASEKNPTIPAIQNYARKLVDSRIPSTTAANHAALLPGQGGNLRQRLTPPAPAPTGTKTASGSTSTSLPDYPSEPAHTPIIPEGIPTIGEVLSDPDRTGSSHSSNKTSILKNPAPLF